MEKNKNKLRLNVATEAILWQTPTFAPQPPILIPLPEGTLAKVEGLLSVVNGVDTARHCVSLDARTGDILMSFQSSGTSLAGPAVVDGTLCWGSGNDRFSYVCGPTNNKLYGFSLHGRKTGQRSRFGSSGPILTLGSRACESVRQTSG